MKATVGRRDGGDRLRARPGVCVWEQLGVCRARLEGVALCLGVSPHSRHQHVCTRKQVL